MTETHGDHAAYVPHLPQDPRTMYKASEHAAHHEPPHHETHAAGADHYTDPAAGTDDRFVNAPGRNAPFATEEVDPHTMKPVHTTYSPKHDGQPDPGEIVWTWVPYEEHDGQGKDRPVLLVARETDGTLLAVKLTSKRHDDTRNWIDIGTGPWDRDARESWAVIDRVMRVHHEGIRRETCALEKLHFDQVVEHLDAKYRWN